jgi:hypothetical protein
MGCQGDPPTPAGNGIEPAEWGIANTLRAMVAGWRSAPRICRLAHELRMTQPSSLERRIQVLICHSPIKLGAHPPVCIGRSANCFANF